VNSHARPVRLRNKLLKVVVASTLALAPAFAAHLAMAANLGSNVSPNTSSYNTQNAVTYFAYVKPGEYLVTAGSNGTGVVTAPDGTSDTAATNDVTFSAPRAVTAADQGVWTAVYSNVSTWSITVYDGDPADASTQEIPGRVWSERYEISQGGSSGKDITFWMVNDHGYQYEVKLLNYNGQSSTIQATDTGIPVSDLNCAPSNRSWDRPHPDPSCGDSARMFFEPPAADLPVSAPMWSTVDGAAVTQTVKPAPYLPDSVVASDFSFTRTGALWAEGTFDYDLGAAFSGSHLVQIDVNGNGVFTDAVDRQIRANAEGAALEVDFDGLDGTGAAIPQCSELTARVLIDRVGEIHVLQNDVELRGGIEVTRQNGAASPSDVIYWDDTQLGPRANTTAVVDGMTGVASTGGVHGWANNSNSWGNSRMIDDFTYVPTSRIAGTTTVGGTCDDDAALTIAKSSVLDDTNSNGLADIGEQITYSFLVTNSSDVDMTGVAVNDDKVTGIAPATADIAHGGAQVFTAAPYTVTQADIDAGQVLNEATASGSYTTPNGTESVTSDPDTETTPTPARAPGLTVEKSAQLVDTNSNGVADAGETVNYTFDVENTGNVTLTGVTVDDPKVSSVSPGPVTLAPTDTQTFTASYVVQSSDVTVGGVYNEATATGTSPLGPFRSVPDDVTVDTPDPQTGLQMTKSGALTTDQDGDGEADLDDVITYTFTVQNTGNVDLEDVVVNDAKVTGISPASAGIAAGSSQVFTATYTVTQADVDADIVYNSATASGTFDDPNDPGNPVGVDSPPDTDIIEVDQNPGLSVEKSSSLDDTNGNGYADVDEVITYTFDLTNTGNTTLENVTVVDPKIGATSPASVTLPVGGHASVTATYVVTQTDVDDGVVHNEATARGTVPGGPEAVADPDDDDVPVPPAAPALSIEKHADLADDDSDGIADKGETVVYSFVVTNTGNVTLHDVTVDDPMLVDAGLAVDPASVTLAPGEHVTFVAEPYEITASDVKDRSLKNVATATGTAPAGDDVESDTDTVVVDTAPDSDGGTAGGGLLPSAGGPAGTALVAGLAAMGIGTMLLWFRRAGRREESAA